MTSEKNKKKIMSFMGLTSKEISQTHENWSFRQIAQTDLFHLFFPNLGEKCKKAVIDSIDEMLINEWSLLNNKFEESTYLIMHMWKQLLALDDWPSDYSSEFVNLFNFKALKKQGLICHRTLSIILKDMQCIFQNSINWSQNVHILRVILSYHVFGCRLFKVECQKDMQKLLERYAINIISDSYVSIYFVFCFCESVIFSMI